MIVIFGWMKETKPVRPLFESYCYQCQRSVTWHLWRETEWVSFFAIKTVPFIWRNFLVCPRCEHIYHLEWKRYLQLEVPGMHDEISKAIEEGQLSQKNELQRKFLLTQRAEREAREKSAT